MKKQNTQKQNTTQSKKQSTQKQSTQKKSQQSAQKLTAKLNELSTEQFKAMLTEAVDTAQRELAEEEAQQIERIERTVTDRDVAELKAVAQSFKIRDNGFMLYLETAKDFETAEGEGTDNSVLVGRYGYGSNGKGELISVWMRRKATERKALMLTEWKNGKKKATEKHAFPCDFGLRFSQNDFELFNSIADCKAILDSLDTEHAEVKHNEPRYSFKTLSEVTEALAKLYNAYEASQPIEATKEATAETTEAKEA